MGNEVLHRDGVERNIIHTVKRGKANWIGQILHGNSLLKHVVGGKVEGRIEVTGRRGIRRRQLLDEVKGKRRYLKLEEEALDRAAWGTGFKRDCGPVARQTACRSNCVYTNWLLGWLCISVPLCV